MFVAFTAAGLWLGWNAHLVQRRRDLAESLTRAERGYTTAYLDQSTGLFRSPGGTVFTWRGGPDVTVRSLQFMLSGSEVYSPNAPPRVSLLRRWLGDQTCATVVLYERSDLDRVRREFPEAIVLVTDRPQPAHPRKLSVAAQMRVAPERSVIVHRSGIAE